MSEQINLREAAGTEFAGIFHKEATLTEDEMIALATHLLRSRGVPLKIWSRGDVLGETDEKVIDGSEEAVADEVWNSPTALKQLEECTDTDWQIIADAVENAAARLGVKA